VGDVPDLRFEPQAPLTLKGKRAPVPVYTVTRSS
jgi:class 3 adenylate cyclase